MWPAQIALLYIYYIVKVFGGLSSFNFHHHNIVLHFEEEGGQSHYKFTDSGFCDAVRLAGGVCTHSWTTRRRL